MVKTKKLLNAEVTEVILKLSTMRVGKKWREKREHLEKLQTQLRAL